MERMPLPYPPTFQVGPRAVDAATVQTLLAPLLTARRRERIAAVVARRTWSLAVVLEGFYDQGNVAAVLRSAEAIGCGAVHVIESCDGAMWSKRPTAGADRWLDVQRWPTTPPCLAALRAQGYRLAVATLADAVPIGAVDWSVPTALLFGSEHAGPSAAALAAADVRCAVPMAGFVESFNVSVAAALCLYHARADRARRLGDAPDLSAAEQAVLVAEYFRRSVTDADATLATLLARQG